MGHDGMAMGHEGTNAQDTASDTVAEAAGAVVVHDTAVRERLLDAARALVLDGDGKFSISALCARAGVERAAFRMHFTGKTALMAAVMQKESGAEPEVAPEAIVAAVAAAEPALALPAVQP